MRKHRLEIVIGSLFAALVVALMWQFLATVIPGFSFFPWILLGAVGFVLLSVVGDAFLRQGSAREKYAPKHFAQVLAVSVVGIGVMFVLAVLLHRPNFSKTIDLSEGQIHSLSPETLKFLEEGVDEKIQFVCVPDPQSQYGDYCHESSHLVGLYTQTNPDKIGYFELDFADQAQVAAVNPTGVGRFVLLTESGKRKEIEGTLDESKLTNGIMNLMRSSKTVYFLTGAGEPSLTGGSPRNYSSLVDLLKARGYESKPLDPAKDSLPSDAEVIVAGSNTLPYGANVQELLEKHVMSGGRLLLSLYPLRDSGLSSLLAKIGIKPADRLLVGNQGATLMGQRWREVNPLRPPVSIGSFSRLSDVTAEFPVSARFPVSEAVPLEKVSLDDESYKVSHTLLMEAMDAAPITLTNTERIRIPEKGAIGVSPDANYDPKASYPVGYELEITGLKDKEGSEKETQVYVAGFDFAASRFLYPPSIGVEVQFPLLAISDLYQDKELISIPSKDYKPKAFRMDRNPMKFLFIFAFLLPGLTIVTGIYIWSRRRLA